MSTMIKRIQQFRYSQINSVQSEQSRMHKNNNYKNKNIDENFKKYNISILDNTEGLTYNQYFNKYCVRRLGGKTKAEVAEGLKDKEFYLDKLYKGKGGGKATTCVEAMVVSFNKRIPATKEAIEAFQNDEENKQLIDDTVKYITEESNLKDCRFLNIDVHYDEVYRPWERKEPSEDFPEGELIKGEPMVSVHMHISYIPLVKEKIKDKDIEFEALNRGEIWKSKTKNYRQSYSQFNDRIFEAVEEKHGYVRGELYEESIEDRKDDTIQNWKLKHDREMEEEYKLQQEKKLQIARAKTTDLVDELEEAEREKHEIVESRKKEIKEEIDEILEKQKQTLKQTNDLLFNEYYEEKNKELSSKKFEYDEQVQDEFNAYVNKMNLEVQKLKRVEEKIANQKIDEIRKDNEAYVAEYKKLSDEDVAKTLQEVDEKKKEIEAEGIESLSALRKEIREIEESNHNYEYYLKKNGIETDPNNASVEDYKNLLKEAGKFWKIAYQVEKLIDTIFKEFKNLGLYRPINNTIKEQVGAFVEQLKTFVHIFNAGKKALGIKENDEIQAPTKEKIRSGIDKTTR